MTLSYEYKAETSCDLCDPDHWVPDEFVEVLELAAKNADVEVEVASTGCGSCYSTDADTALFWVAQNSARDYLAVNHGSDTLESKEIFELVAEAGAELGIPVSCPKDDSYTIMLGVENYYHNLEAGTFVEKPRKYGKGKKGVVLDPDSYNPRMDYRVYDQDDYDGIGCGGDTIGEFPTKEEADEYSEQKDCETYVGFIRKHGFRDGENLVQWIGDSTPSVVGTKDIRVIDDE